MGKKDTEEEKRIAAYFAGLPSDIGECSIDI
jgi:hypothetical protein